MIANLPLGRFTLPALAAAALAAATWGTLAGPRFAAGAEGSPALPAVAPFKLGKGQKLGKGPNKENSGIVKSRRWPDLFWMHNDAGNKPRIYAVHRDGKVYQHASGRGEAGVLLEGAQNVDWEDIDIDASGRVIVADIGNNENDRRDLVLYYIDEPEPHAERVAVVRKVRVSYPEQKKFPAPKDDFNYDAEAIFTLGDQVFICTKHRSDTLTTVYRVDAPADGEQGVLTRVGEFDVRGKATSADATADGRRVVLLTYDSLWLFDVTDPAHPLSGPVQWLPFKEQSDAEAVCFADEETLLVGDESEKRLYEVPIARFVPVAR